jgi:hypothetical protein
LSFSFERLFFLSLLVDRILRPKGQSEGRKKEITESQETINGIGVFVATIRRNHVLELPLQWRSNGTATSKLVVVLRLSSSLLRKFAPVPDTKDKRRKSSTAAAIASNKTTEAAGSPLKREEVPSSPSLSAADPAPAASSVDTASDAASTPAAAPSAADRRKGLPGPKPGAKRGLNATPDSNLKPRGKPGPKKRPRL